MDEPIREGDSRLVFDVFVNLPLLGQFQSRTRPAYHSEITYEFPARKICAIKGMTLETDGEPFLNRWIFDVCHVLYAF